MTAHGECSICGRTLVDGPVEKVSTEPLPAGLNCGGDCLACVLAIEESFGWPRHGRSA